MLLQELLDHPKSDPFHSLLSKKGLFLTQRISRLLLSHCKTHEFKLDKIKY